MVGDILGRFFNPDGFISRQASVDTNISKNVPGAPEQVYLGIPADSLRKAKTILCLCGGTQKIPAILTAARHGYFNFLVTDSATAKELIEALGEDA